ncbi:MAG: UDP-glucose 4-epimerase [Solirubrobacteraceae bacterium]|jgi:nucleoside-diphosphate-sugar epimerase|nr:UDP-glucose 4-epimerase [Solirubrobacteraceae bacterium]
MRVVVTGATGNVGTSLLEVLSRDPAIEDIVGLARRRPQLELARTRWVTADIARDDLSGHFRGADCVVHLAWVLQASRNRPDSRAVNVDGSRRVFEAAAAAGVPSLVHASSIGAYARGPKDRRVDESWPIGGIPSSAYSRDKAEVERILDRFEAQHPDMRVVRHRPALIFKAQVGSAIRRLFVGPLLPPALLRTRLIPVVPAHDRLRVQAVHSLDAADAYHRAIVREVRGAFNIAAEPVIDGRELGRLLGALPVPVAPALLRAAFEASWKLRLQPSPPSWLDVALGIPLMDVSRARRELGWSATRSAGDVLLELLDGMRRGDGAATGPLAPTGGQYRCGL